MNWVDEQTLEAFMERQRRRVVLTLDAISVGPTLPSDDDHDEHESLTGYTRRELLRSGCVERRA